MIMTCLQAFTHGRQARLLSSGRRLVQFALCQPLLVGACEKLFRVLEVNDVGVVDVTDVIDGDPLIPIDGKGEVKYAVDDPSTLECW